QALKAATLNVRVTAFICEQDASCYTALVRNLIAAKLRTPVVEVSSFGRDGFGSVNVLRGDFREHVAALQSILGPGKNADPFVLALVDPYGPSMPMAAVRSVIGRPRTDAIVLFPYYDLEVRSGSAAKEVQDRQP